MTNPDWDAIDEAIARGGQVQRDEAAGKIRYIPVLAFDARELLRKFSDAACAAHNAYQQG